MKVKDLINLIFGIKDFMLVSTWNGKILYKSWSSSKKKLDELVDLEVLGISANVVLINLHHGDKNVKPVVEVIRGVFSVESYNQIYVCNHIFSEKWLLTEEEFKLLKEVLG